MIVSPVPVHGAPKSSYPLKTLKATSRDTSIHFCRRPGLLISLVMEVAELGYG